MLLAAAAFAVALPGCTSDQTQSPEGIGSVGMAVTLATPPSGPNEQIDAVNVSLYCEGIDPVLGVPRPAQSSPESFTINVSTSQGPEPYNTIGLFEKQGLPAGPCHFEFFAVSNTGNTECTGNLSVVINTDSTTQGEVVLACIHTPRYGGIRTDGTFNQCAEYRQILVTPTTQSIGNLIDVQTEVYDPDGDPVTVSVGAAGACGNVATVGSDTAASCETVSGCEAVVNTVECTDVGPCQIIVAVSDDGFDSCTGLLPDGSNNNAARSTIDVDCTVAQGCGNDQLDPGEDCDPPDGIFCDDNCQDIDNCSPDPCNQSNACSPEVCSADPGDNSAICTPDPGSAAGNVCSPPAGGTCDGAGNCVACSVDTDCEDNNACTDNACVAGACEFTNDDNNQCSVGGLPGTCSAGTCEGLCTGVICPDPGECVTGVCDPADGQCQPQNDGINTGCDFGPGPGVCDGAGACVQCNIDAQCVSGEACVNNVCELTLVCEYEQDFEALDPAASDALQSDGWLYFGNVFDGTGAFKFGFGPFPAPTTTGQISAIATGEGGPDQGANQLLVFSNYDCCGPGTTNEGHFNGTDLVETIVFQEINPILAIDIGRTFTFEFDAKRGNIGGATTAQAFIRTLDPNAGFATTNNVVLDTTSIPASWATYSITLDLSDPALVGQILQFGFSTVASNFEGAGNFYDNISFCAPGGGGGDPFFNDTATTEIYTTGTAINYGPYRAGGPGSGEFPSDADLLQDLSLMDTAGYNLIRLFGADPVHERILQLAEANFPEMQFQQGLFVGGLAPGPEADNCDNADNDSQVATAIRLANTYPSVATVSVGNETSFFAPFMPLNCLEGYITETRDNVTQPVTADDDYTFYANFFGRSPDEVMRRIDFVSIHTYPFLNYQQWDWRQEAVPAGPLRAEAMMNASLAKAQDNYQAVYDYRYRNASGVTVTVGETRPIVIGETGWKWRQTAPTQEIETYAANPVNAKWYKDLMATWERSPGGPVTVMDFVAFDEAWKLTDDGWGFWDELRQPNYALCDTPAAGAPCTDPVYQGAGFFTP
jgi:exo-beta-1,3-glucanase (GH17 family)